MIKIVEYAGQNTARNVVVLFADTKTEVPSTGADTATAAHMSKAPAAGSVLYTAKLAVAVLKSSDRWDWGD